MKTADTLKVRFEDVEWVVSAEYDGPRGWKAAFDREYPVADFQDCLTYDPATDEYLLNEDAAKGPLAEKLADGFGWRVRSFRWRFA